jgi:hypothetical protein
VQDDLSGKEWKEWKREYHKEGRARVANLSLRTSQIEVEVFLKFFNQRSPARIQVTSDPSQFINCKNLDA